MSQPRRQHCTWDTTTTEHPKYKSRICRHWLRGFCKLGNDCNFAHGWGERRAYQNNAGKPEDQFLELGMEPMEIITDWHELGKIYSGTTES